MFFYHVLPREDSCSHIWNEGASALSLTAAEQGDRSTTLTGSNIQGLLRPSAQINGPFGLCNVSKTQPKTSFYCDVTSFLLKRTENILSSYTLSSLETIEMTLGTGPKSRLTCSAFQWREHSVKPVGVLLKKTLMWCLSLSRVVCQSEPQTAPDATADNGQVMLISPGEQVAPRRKPLPENVWMLTEWL